MFQIIFSIQEINGPHWFYFLNHLFSNFDTLNVPYFCVIKKGWLFKVKKIENVYSCHKIFVFYVGTFTAIGAGIGLFSKIIS